MKKNLVKKAVLPALAALLCSVIALTSVSYAWFTMGNSATVGSMNMQVTTADGLQISATGNANDFKSTLLTTELGGNVQAMQLDTAKVQPLSTDGTVTSGQMVFFTAAYNDSGVLVSTANGSGANYIWFDIYVKVSSEKDLYLDTTSTVICSGKNTHLASRVAFFDMGSADKAADAQALTTTSSATGNTAYIWEPNSQDRTTAATNEGYDSGKLGYKGINAAGNNIAGVDVTTFDVDSASVKIAHVESGYNKIRVFIWLEGQDVDCLNEVSGGQLVIDIKLTQQNPKA